MSLEDKIQGLTDAVNALTAALAHPYPTLSGRTDTLSGRADTLSETEVAPPKPEPLASVTTTTPVGPSNTVDYAQVAKAITDTFKVDRAKTIAALAKFGAAKGPQLKPEDYAAFLKELTA
jgi:hypothetical protein